jgi:hypothetical protein
MAVMLMGLGGLLSIDARPAAGQGWAVDLQSGRSVWESVPLGSNGIQAGVGLRHSAPRRIFQAGLTAPLQSGNMGWGVASLTQRASVRTGRLEWGVDAAGLLHAQRDPGLDRLGWGVRGDFLPFVGSSLGPTVVEARSGISRYRGALSGETWARSFQQTDLRLSLPLDRAAAVGGEVRQLRNRDETHTWVGGSISVAHGRGAAWGSAGRWIEGVTTGQIQGSWGLGVSLALTASTTLWASARSDAFDPFYLSAPRSSWGIGVSRRLGAARSVPAGPGIYPRGTDSKTSGTLVRIPLGSARTPPAVAGDFSGWVPVPMHRNGLWWEAELSLSPGLHHLAFQRADGSWFVPEELPNRRSDGMGGWVAVVVIPEEEP